MTLDNTIVVIRAVTILAPVIFVLIITISTRSVLNARKSPIRAFAVPISSSIFIFTILSVLPLLVEDILNRGGVPLLDIHTQNAKKHSHRFDVADLHCDMLLWGGRDFRKKTFHPIAKNRLIGAVDLPRMLDGRVKLQVFAAVNSIPRHINFRHNERPNVFSDPLVLKTILERWPAKTWFSPKQRVLHQFRRLAAVAKEDSQLLRITRSKADLRDTAGAVQPMQSIMAVEGLSCLNNDIATVKEFFEAGIRVLGPTHFFDTEIGGSRSGACKCGITDFGRDVLRRMKSLDMIVDLAHASDQLILDILDTRPEERPHLMISHTGVKAVCPSGRNLGDDLITRIASAGGLIGVTLFKPALCGEDIIESFVRSVAHVSQITGGVRSLALGSDWDGNVFTAVSAADTHILSASLMEIGNFSYDDVRRIMYDNAYEFFLRSLPD